MGVVILGLAVLAGVLLAIGLSLKTHRAESRLTLEKPPAEVWTVIEILPRWWEPGPISRAPGKCRVPAAGRCGSRTPAGSTCA